MVNKHEDILQNGFDAFIRIDLLPVMPAIGWIYDGTKFVVPPEGEPQDPMNWPHVTDQRYEGHNCSY